MTQKYNASSVSKTEFSILNYTVKWTTDSNFTFTFTIVYFKNKKVGSLIFSTRKQTQFFFKYSGVHCILWLNMSVQSVGNYVIVHLYCVFSSVVSCRITYLQCTDSGLSLHLHLRSLTLLQLLLVLQPGHFRCRLTCQKTNSQFLIQLNSIEINYYYSVYIEQRVKVSNALQRHLSCCANRKVLNGF